MHIRYNSITNKIQNNHESCIYDELEQVLLLYGYLEHKVPQAE